jgi:diacylglycerol kinase family enzyme
MPATPLESLERLGERLALPSSLERKRMLVIVNPYATTVSDRLRTLVVYALQGRYDVEAIDTQRRDHATELCREAAQEGYDVVVSFGGDGTVNEAANGLVGSPTPLTCLPGGATNVLCKMLGIPGEIVDATEHLLRLADDWRPQPIDLATVNGRCFTFGAGIGLDASVVKRVDARPHLKTTMRQWYFAYAGVDEFLRRYVVDAPRIELEVCDGPDAGDRGEPLRGVTAIIQNGDPFTYFKDRPLHVAEGATLHSGTLAGVMLRRASPIDVPTVIHRMFSRRRRVVDHPHIASFTGATELVCRSADGRPLALQVDGDFIGDVTEARFGVRPGAISVLA